MSRILCIIDGMTDPGFRPGDYPCLASMSYMGDIDTVENREPESLGCILRLLGIREIPAHLRGYTEALAADIPAAPGDLIFRGSWFSIDPLGRCCRPIPGPETLPTGRDFRIYPIGGYKSLVIFPGRASALPGIQTLPPYRCAGMPAKQFRPAGDPALEACFDRALTAERCLILWGASVPSVLPPFPKRAAVICGTPVVKGIALQLGMEPWAVTSATGDTDTCLPAKLSAALQAARRYPFVLLHINGADEAAHRRNPGEKRRFLEKIDRLVIPPLLESGHKIYLTGDHGTDPATGLHTSAPQPLFSYGC